MVRATFFSNCKSHIRAWEGGEGGTKSGVICLTGEGEGLLPTEKGVRGRSKQ